MELVNGNVRTADERGGGYPAPVLGGNGERGIHVPLSLETERHEILLCSSLPDG